MQQLKLNVRRIQVVRGRGADRVSLELDSVISPFPELDSLKPGQYPATLNVDVRRGYTETFLRSLGFVEEQGFVEIIDIGDGRSFDFGTTEELREIEDDRVTSYK